MIHKWNILLYSFRIILFVIRIILFIYIILEFYNILRKNMEKFGVVLTKTLISMSMCTVLAKINTVNYKKPSNYVIQF